MIIETRSGRFQLSNPTADSTSVSIVQPLPSQTPPDVAPASQGVATAPNGLVDGVFALGGGSPSYVGGIVSPNSLLLVPFGNGQATNTFSMNVYAWRAAATSKVGNPCIWVPYILAGFSVTLGTASGLGFSDVNSEQLFATSITLVTGNANVSNEIISPGGNMIAHILMDAKGSQFVEIRYGTAGSASGANCLVAAL